MKKTNPININDDKFILKKVNEYFKNLRICNNKNNLINCECVYTGSMSERKEKYEEFKKYYYKK